MRTLYGMRINSRRSCHYACTGLLYGEYKNLHALQSMMRNGFDELCLDETSGRMIAALPSVQDTDDLYCDSVFKRIYISGAEGCICVFQVKDPDHYSVLAKIPTAIGARTAAYFAGQGRASTGFYLAVPARQRTG